MVDIITSNGRGTCMEVLFCHKKRKIQVGTKKLNNQTIKKLATNKKC